MNDNSSGEQLIGKLLTDPVGFNEQGEAYQLLQEYFHGMPVDTLRPLLSHSDRLVRGAAVFVASELGEKAKSLVHEVAPLIHDPDPNIQWDALESVMVCSTGTDVDQFLSVVQELDNDNDSMRRLAMRLVANADLSQLEMGSKLSRTLGSSAKLHEQGLLVLLKGDSVNESEVTKMLDNPAPLIRKYGAIAAKRWFEKFPKLLEHAALSSDPDISRFSTEALEMFRDL